MAASAGTASAAGAVLGQRERNKRDKLLRIREAARELFLSKGYDETTIREITLRAGVGLGTLFSYASNKRDLLFLVVNDELAAGTETAAAAIHDDAPLLANLMTIFRAQYRLFDGQKGLARLTLREMVFYDDGLQASRFQATRERLIALVERAVRIAQATGGIATDEDPALAGWVAFCIYQVELRRWAARDDLDLDAGMTALQRALTLYIRGLAPTAATLASLTPAAKPIRGRPKVG